MSDDDLRRRIQRLEDEARDRDRKNSKFLCRDCGGEMRIRSMRHNSTLYMCNRCGREHESRS